MTPRRRICADCEGSPADDSGQPVNDNIRNLVNKYGISTDWRDEMIKNSAPTSDINATLQGGGQTMNYFVSFNHHQEDGLIEDSNMRRSTLAARINSRSELLVHQVADIRLQLQLRCSGLQPEQHVG